MVEVLDLILANPVTDSKGVDWDSVSLPPAIRILDCRRSGSFKAGHIAGSSRLEPEFDEMSAAYLRPPRHRAVWIISDSASFSRSAASIFRSDGWNARAIDFPIEAWPGPWEVGEERRPAWEPSFLVARWIDRLRGPIVDLACGTGRDAVYMALHGHHVVAIDILPDAIDRARRLAARHKVGVDWRVADVEKDPSCWGGPWGTIHIHRFLDRGAFPMLRARLIDGGLLLFETFIERQAIERGRPKRPDHFLREGELRAVAEGMDVLEYEEGRTLGGDWTARLAARKGVPDDQG